MNQSWVPGMFSDGLVYAAISKNLTIHNIFPKLFYSQNYYAEFWEHPPFIIGLQALIFKIVGISWSSAKILNLFWNLANVFLLFFFIKKERDEKTAFISAMILVLTYPFLRISRFPNMDVALCFFSLLSFINYYFYLKFKKKKYWYYLGFCFGLALLCKGHPALLIPFAVGVHLLVSKQYKMAFSKWPWVSFVIGLTIFAIWPLLLWFNGSFYGFVIWFKKQFLATVIDSRGRVEYDFFIYFKNLFKSTLPWFLSFLFFTYNVFKKKSINNDVNKNEKLPLLIVCFFWAIITPLSIVKFKYGHYIASVYPFMAMGAGLYLSELPYTKKIFKYLSQLVMFAGLVLLAFPLTNTIRRDFSVHKSIEVLKKTNYQIKNFGFVGNAASRWSFIGTVVFSSSYNPIESSSNNCVLLKQSAYLIKKNNFNCFKKNPQLFKLKVFNKENIVLVINL